MTSIGSTGGIGNFEERLTGPGLADHKRSAGGGRSIFSKLTCDVPAGPLGQRLVSRMAALSFPLGSRGMWSMIRNVTVWCGPKYLSTF